VGSIRVAWSNAEGRASVRFRLAVLGALVAPLCLAPAPAASGPVARTDGSPTPFFEPRQQTDLDFGLRSHWLQPWRGYVDTPPATRVRDGLGINFNVAPAQAETVATLLAAAGFRRVRYEIPWCWVSYDDPAHLTNEARLDAVLGAFARHRLRPLILLNAHEGCPGPLRHLQVRLAAPAAAGARTLLLDPASAQQVVPGLTGLDSTTQYKAAATLFTALSGTTVTLSKPLDRNLAAGASLAASTLEYRPFGQVGTAAFERTMAGWLEYVGLVADKVRSVLGGDAFDIEVWNELSFGSGFLNVNSYYSPPAEQVSQTGTQRALLQRTVDYLRDPANGDDGVGIGDGFTNEQPFDSGATVPAGVTALDKHPYAGPIAFPANARYNGVRPLDALGNVDGWQDAQGRWHDDFVPSYVAYFPEYFLTAIQTETAIRDLSPITTAVYGTPHGRFTHPAGASAPTLWVTEAGLDPARVPAAVLPRFQAKEALRYAIAWLNKGASAVYYYAAFSPGWGLVDLSAPGGGSALTALGRLSKTLANGAAAISKPRSMGLASVADDHDHAQFAGDGTAAHPPLYDRDVLGFFPFQVSSSRVAIGLYVMTRDLLYDLPPEHFRLTVTGTGGLGTAVSATDPLTGTSVPVTVLSRGTDQIVVDVPLTDAPRILVLG
jgi:hypothetical protein